MQRTRNGLLAAVTLAAMVGCGNHDDSSSKPGQGQLPNVKIAQPLSQEVTEWDEYTGRIEAVNSVEVRGPGERLSGESEFQGRRQGKQGRSFIPDRSETLHRLIELCCS